MERDKTTTQAPETTSLPVAFNLLEALSPSNSRESTKIANVDGQTPSIDEIVKELNSKGLNSVTPSTLSKTYGSSNDAILAALLKEQGIEPSTPKSLREQLNLAVSKLIDRLHLRVICYSLCHLDFCVETAFFYC